MLPMQSELFSPHALKDAVVAVSGYGTGLGRAMAIELAQMGATVVGCGRRQELLDQTTKLIGEAGGASEARAVDIRDEEQVNGFIEGILDRHGRLDVLVNNAGGQFVGPAEDVSPKGLRTVLDLNVVGSWMMTRAAATRAFMPQGRGRVISITLSPHNGSQGSLASAAARAGVENMTRTLSLEWGRHGISLVAVASGVFMTDVIEGKYPAEMVASWAATTSVGRLGDPREMAQLVAYLATPAASYITGTVVTIDGGRDNGPPQHTTWPEDRSNNFRAKQATVLGAGA